MSYVRNRMWKSYALTAITATLLGAMAYGELAVAQTPPPMKRFHAQFCLHETKFPEDLRIFGFEVLDPEIGDGRIENGSGGIFPSTKTLFCPIITDSNLPHEQVVRVAVHGIDDSKEVEVEVFACVGSAFGFTTVCGPLTFSSGSTGGLTSNTDFEGPFAVPVVVSPFGFSSFEFRRGYPVLVIRLPTNGDTRLTGYTICGGDKSLCDPLLFPAGSPGI